MTQAEDHLPSLRRKPLTARELARLMGVSQSAISRAFTPGSSISPDLRQRILQAAAELDYHPNAIASMLSKRRSNIAGIVVSEMQNPFYPTLIEKLSRGLQRVRLQSLMFNITRGSNVEEQLVALRQYNVDAVIIISATILSGASIRWATEGRAAVLVNRTIPDLPVTSVSCDNVEGARAIADHFHALGRHRVSYVAGLAHTSTNLERQNAFVTRVAELGMRLVHCIAGGEYSYDAGYRAGLEIARGKDTDAVFFANDILAAGGFDALTEIAKLRVPEDIAVAGFDDVALTRWPHYSLTTFRQPVDAIVDKTVSLITQQLSDATLPPSFNALSGELIIRHSTMGGQALEAIGEPAVLPPTTPL
ncbi:MAG: LacI family DNA-binding transcriptional regulator [Pseudomonadota bacterium]|nr:LacI family DNA-binding transcriptional regulator [Pseudomonadota bacterium]